MGVSAQLLFRTALGLCRPVAEAATLKIYLFACILCENVLKNKITIKGGFLPAHGPFW